MSPIEDCLVMDSICHMVGSQEGSPAADHGVVLQQFCRPPDNTAQLTDSNAVYHVFPFATKFKTKLS